MPLLLLFCMLAGPPGCSRQHLTEPLQTASHQFLMTQAITQAVDRLAITGLRDQLVFVDGTYLNVEQEAYLLAEVRNRLLVSGVRLTNDRETARIVLEVRSGGIGIDRYEFMVGIPSIMIPSAKGDVALTPELPLLKNQRRSGFASVAFVAYFRESGELLTSSGPFIGRTTRQDYWLLSTTPRATGNIPTTEGR